MPGGGGGGGMLLMARQRSDRASAHCAIVPSAGSGHRTHRAVLHSKLVVVNGAPHGLNVSNTQAFNDALLSFLRA